MAKEKKESAFMHWYESYQGKTVVNTVYSVGASVVIVGALFKILHWPGASQVLMVGMFTEAFLFIIGVLEKPHPEFHWDNVFPQLLEYGADPNLLEEKAHKDRPTLLGAGVEGAPVPVMGGNGGNGGGVTINGSASGIAGLEVSAVDEKDMAELKNGMTELAKTANQLAELSKMATTTSELSAKLVTAGNAAEKFAASQENLASAAQALSTSYAGVAGKFDVQSNAVSDAYATMTADMQQINTKLSSLNSVYELQINAVQSQADALKQAADNLQGMQNASKVALESTQAYSMSAKQLADQVANLNQIYGNMLNALA